MRPILDPWIEGYLDYQLKVRRLRPLITRRDQRIEHPAW